MENIWGKRKQKDFKDKKSNNKEEKMTRFVRNGRVYYTTRKEAERVRKRGQTIRYSTKYRAYYIVDINQDSWWGW